MITHFYQYHPYETGIFVEIFLPKRAEFQGTLYRVLTEGFDLEKVKNHFRNSHKRDKIKRLLEKYYDEVANYTEENIENFPQVFFGYSMYEVDGVFLSKRKGIVEERTQIVRIIFMPDFEHLYEHFRLDENPVENELRIVNIVKLFLRVPNSNDENFFKDFKVLTKREKALVKYISKWVDDIGLFLFGYVVYEICERILDLHFLDENSGHQLEDEIWVTSFWHFAVNRIVFKEE
jgi:hypothetical protein